MSLDISFGEYSGNITHNLNRMAKAINVTSPYGKTLYDHLWNAEENKIPEASELTMPLLEALRELHGDPDKYYPYEPANGWGSYSGFIRFLEEMLVNTLRYPNAKIEVDK